MLPDREPGPSPGRAATIWQPKPGRISSRREWVFIPLAAAAYVTLAFLTEPSLFQATDFLKHWLPNEVYLRQRLMLGRLPMWNPYVGLGRPFLADLSTASLYPPMLLGLASGPHLGVVLLTVLHLSLGGLAMSRLGRELGLRDEVRWLLAFAFVANGPVLMLVHSGQVLYAWGLMYLPLCFLLALRLQDDFRASRLAALALALALQLLSGHPQVAWTTWVGVGAFLLGRSLDRSLRLTLTRSVVGLGGYALALVWAFGLSAMQLGPLFELVGQSNRADPTVESASIGSLYLSRWASLIIPIRPGNQIEPAAYLFVGLPIAIAGAAGLARLGDRNVRGLSLAAVLGVLVAAGDRTPAFQILYYLIPGLSSFHFHGRAAFLLCFCLVLGAGVFLSDVGRKRAGLVMLAGTAGAALAVTVIWHQRMDLAPTPVWLSMRVLFVMACGVCLAAWHMRDGRRRWPLMLIGFLAAAEAMVSAVNFKKFCVGPGPFLVEKLVVDRLQKEDLYPAAGIPPRISVPYSLIRDNSGQLYKYSNLSGYVALHLGRVWSFLHDRIGIPLPVDQNEFPSPRIFDVGPFPYDSMNLVLGFDPASGQLRINDNPDPRAYLAYAAQSVGDGHEAASLMRAGHDFHRVALIESRSMAALGAGGHTGGTGLARIVQFEPERIVVEAEASQPALLVLAEPWYPGWRAAVNGRPAPCLPANAWMRAVPVLPGRSRVVLLYASTYLVPGAVVSASSALAMTSVLVIGHRRRRSRARAKRDDTGGGAGRDRARAAVQTDAEP